MFALASQALLSTKVVKAGIITGDRVSEPSLVSWFLAMTLEGKWGYILPLA